MATLSKAERGNIRAGISELVGYAERLRDEAEGAADRAGGHWREQELEQHAEYVEAIGAELDEMLYRAK